MKRFLKSLYGKIAVIFLILMVIITVTQVVLTLRACTDFMKEADQRVNVTLASNLSRALRPHLSDKIDYEGIHETLHRLMVINPEIEIYLLDESGSILTCLTGNSENLALQTVSLEPIHRFLTHHQGLPILGDDPRGSDLQKPFSVAPIPIGTTDSGYIYVVLDNANYDSISRMLAESYIVRGALGVLGITFIFSVMIGLLAFAYVTRRVHKMTDVVQRFEQGELGERIPVTANDEIGQLGKAFNQMADTIVSNLDEIHRQERFRRDLIANISHDLRSPLAAIQGYLEMVLLKNEQLSATEKQQYLETLFKNAQQVSRLVDELFELSKLDARQIQPKPEPFSLIDLVHDVVMKYKPRAKAAHIQLHCRIPKTLPMVYGDIGMIERALSNLVENALTHTPENGEVILQLQREGNTVSVRVSDTGSGIPEEDLPHVFERFYRVDKSRSRSASANAGLGLAITRKILEAHNTAISVSSAINRGTTFVFRLPVQG